MINMDEYVKRNKETYQKGMRVVLDSDMNDDSPYAPKAGECGIIQGVDALGTVHVVWDSGSTLGLIPGEDDFHLV